MTASIKRSGRLRARGMRTRACIVDAARALLLECGSLDFTLREIALRTGISVSNLQYYFPTRLALLRAVLAPVIEACVYDLKQVLDEAAAPRIKLHLLMSRALHDAADAEHAALMRHFLSLVAIDPVSARLLEAWYAMLTRDVTALVCAANPALAKTRCREIAVLMIAVADGVTVRNGAGMRDRGDPHALDQAVRATVDRLLDGPRRES
jgi:AcrR family transcriptional regulator